MSGASTAPSALRPFEAVHSLRERGIARFLLVRPLRTTCRGWFALACDWLAACSCVSQVAAEGRASVSDCCSSAGPVRWGRAAWRRRDPGPLGIWAERDRWNREVVADPREQTPGCEDR